MKLTDENYYSKEANERFMSVSQFKQGLECEARMVAELRGEYQRPYSTALTVGSYIHAAFESNEVFIDFCKQNTDVISTKQGKLKAEFVQAEKMISTLKFDPFCMYALTGEKEAIYTGELFGIQWKIKVDNINHEKLFFSDIKSTKGLHDRYWSNRFGRYVSFVEMYGYDIQMAVYQGIIRQNTGGLIYEPYIVAVTKENVPDKAIIHFDEETLLGALEYVSERIDSVISAKRGEKEPTRCNKCEYCRLTKKLGNTISMYELLD